MIVISPWVLHRHRLLWDDPDLFDPSRFLRGAQRTIERHAYLPFGVGPRMCIGAAFALREATIALATIMSNFPLRLAPGQSVWPRQMVTLRPRMVSIWQSGAEVGIAGGLTAGTIERHRRGWMALTGESRFANVAPDAARALCLQREAAPWAGRRRASSRFLGLVNPDHP